MAFVDVNTGKKISLSKGYESRAITYDEWRRRQEEKRAAGGTDSHVALRAPRNDNGGTADTSGEAWARTAEASARRGVSASNTGGTPTTAQLRNQARQAAVDQDMDTLNRVNDELKRRRAALGKQTVGDRASDTLSGAVQSYGAGVVNAVGTVANSMNDPAYYRRQIASLQKRLEAGGYSDGRQFVRDNETVRQKLRDSMREMADKAWQLERPTSFVNRTYQLADRMRDDSAASIASAKEGAGALGQLAVDVGVAGGQMGMDALTAALTGGSALVPMAVRSFGGGAQEARRSGADLDDQLLYGAGSAALSVGTEKISNIAKPFKKMFGAGAAETIAGSLAKRFGENGAVQMMQRLSQNAAGRIALSAIGEGGEEVVEDVLQPFLKRATYDPGAKFDAGEAGRDFLVGAILGGLGGVPEAVGRIGSKPARNQAETGAGAETRAPVDVETARAETGVQGVQEAPAAAPVQRDVMMEIAARGGKLEAETGHGVSGDVVAPGETAGQQNTAPGAGTAREYHGQIIDTIRANLDKVKGMDSVAELTGQEFQKTAGDNRPLRQKVIEFFNSIGNKVFRPGMGDIELNMAGAKDSTAHGYGKLKAATFAALPSVLEKGTLIYNRSPYEGHDYDSYIISAPVKVNGTTCYVGALVIKDANMQRYKLHEVLTTNENGAPLFKSETHSYTNGRLSSGTPLDGEARTNPTSLAAESGAGAQVPLSEDIHQLLSKGVQFPQAMADDILAKNNIPQPTQEVKSGTEDENGVPLFKSESAGQTDGPLRSDTPFEEPEGSSTTDPTIAQGADSVKFTDPLMQAIFGGGRRVDQSTLSPEQFSRLAELNEQGTVGMDADGRVYQVDPEEHIDRREWSGEGGREVNAFQYDHPELAPYYRAAAQALAADLDQTERGGQIYSYPSDYTEMGGTGYARTRRHTSREIGELLDSGMSYARIEKALDAILQDHGAENYADAKRVELLLDRMLTNGYRGLTDGTTLEPNEAYIREKGQISGAREGGEVSGYLDGVDGLGAADAGSLNSDYDRLQARSDRFHPEGENPARPVDVPMEDFDGNPISQTASTVMGAKAIPDDVIPMIEQMVADGKLSYDPVTNAASEARARAKIEQNGFDGAMEEYRNAVRAGKTSPEIEILGQTLLNNAANARDGKAIAELLSLYQAGGTNLGQAMQARKVMRKLSPEGQLYAIQRSVYHIDGENIKVSPDLIQKFLDQTDQAGRDAVMEEIVKDVAGQLPGSWKKIFDSMRYLAMLGNTRTHVRNLIGNAVFQPFTWAKNRLGGIGEAAAQRAGVDVERTKTATGVNPFSKPAREARAEYKDLADILNNSSHYSEDRTGTKAIREHYNPFKNVKHFQKLADMLDWSLGRLSRGNMSLLEKEDSVFKAFIYGQTLADYLKANGVESIDAASPELLSKARNYAAKEALRNTFNDSNVVSDAVAKLGRARQSENPVVRGLGYAVEGTLPFKRTPANVAVRAVEYSPVGAGMSIIDLVSKGAKREATPETVSKGIDRLAAGLSGSALGFLGFLLAKAGLVTGGDDEDEDQRNFNSLTGHQSYALETEGGTSYTLDWAAPASIPFFMGVELYNMAADGRMSQDDWWRALKNLGSPMLEMSMLQGLNDTFEEAAYAQRHDDSVLAALLTKAATGYFTQVFPTAGGQLERIGEDRRMTTYTDKNKGLSTDTQYTLGKISQKVPGWDYNQIPYIDAWGREEETGDALSRILQNTVSPGYLSAVNVNDVERELQRIKDTTGDSGVFPDRAPKYFNVNKERKDLTAEEYQTYAKKRGQTALEVMGRVTSSEGYGRLSDEQKAQAVKYAYSYADALGKMECSDYKPDSGSMAAGVMKSMLPPEVYILYKINSDRDGNDSISEKESAQTLMELEGLTDKERGEAWSAFNNRGETEESRERKEAKNPFTGVLAGDYSPEEAMAAWGIFDGKGTKEEKYTQERKKKDLQEEFGISVREANDLFALMKRAAGG